MNNSGAQVNVNQVSRNQDPYGGFQTNSNYGNGEIDELRREKNELKIENEKLLRMMRESGQYDMYMLRKENERLNKTVSNYRTFVLRIDQRVRKQLRECQP